MEVKYQDDGKGGLSLRGVAFMTVLAVLTVLESTLPSFCLSYKIQHSEATVAVLTVLAVSAVVAVSVVTATPLKPNPPFRRPESIATGGKSNEIDNYPLFCKQKHDTSPLGHSSAGSAVPLR